MIEREFLVCDSSIEINADPVNYGFNGKYYYPEPIRSSYRGKFKYFDANFGIQALTIPIKIHPALRNDSLFPQQAETGFNIGFAPGYKMNYNVMNPFKKFLGKNLTSYSVTAGALLGFGTVALKGASNAPGLSTVDRTSPTFSYGGYLVLGIDNVNVGCSFGFDNAMGGGGKYWVYQNKIW